MSASSDLYFRFLQDRLRDYIRGKAGRRELAVSRLAMQAGLPQGHLSNFLNHRRGMSLEYMDHVLDTLGIGILDLIAPEEIKHWCTNPTDRSQFEEVPRIRPSFAFIPSLPKDSVVQGHTVEKALLRRYPSNDVAGRTTWQRFVFVDVAAAEVRGIAPLSKDGARLLIDRHNTGLESSRASRRTLFLVQGQGRLVVGCLSLLTEHLVVQPCDGKCDLLTLNMGREQRYWEYIVGRVCQMRTEP